MRALAEKVLSVAVSLVLIVGLAPSVALAEPPSGSLAAASVESGETDQGVADMARRLSELGPDGVWHEQDGSVAADVAIAFSDLATQAVSTQADIVFVIDSTGSMSYDIGKVRRNLVSFVQHIRDDGVDVRVSIVEYRDITDDGPDSTIVHAFYESNWTRDVDAVADALGDMYAEGGGDTEETPTDALARTLVPSWGWRSAADRSVFLVTDAGYKDYDVDPSIPSMKSCIDGCADNDIRVFVVSELSESVTYKRLYESTGGSFINIDSGDFYEEMLDAADDVTSGSKASGASSKSSAFALSRVGMSYNDNSYDFSKINALKDVKCIDTRMKDTPLGFQVKFRNASDKVGEIKLVQVSPDGKTERTVAVADGSGQFRGLKVGSFKAGQTTCVDVYDKSGKRCNRAKLAISFKEGNDALAEIEFQDGIKFKVNGGFLEGFSAELGAMACPIYYSADSDGKIKLGINFDPTEEEGLFEQLKNGVTFKTKGKDLSKALKKPNAAKGLAKSGLSPSVKIIGYAEGSVGSPVLKGVISVEAGVSAYKEIQHSIFVVEFSASAKAKAKASLSLDTSTAAGALIKDGSLDVGLAGSGGLYGGVGLAYLASVGIYGKASTELMWRLMPRSQAGFLSWKIAGELGVKVKLLGRDIASVALLQSGDYYLYRRDASGSISSQEAFDGDALRNALIDANATYPAITSGVSAASSWRTAETALSASVMTAASDGGDGSGVTVLSSNVYPEASPRVVVANGVPMLFFLDVDEGRAEGNRSVLSYSVYDSESESWTSPVAVENDGTADFAFDVAVLDDGRVGVVWQDSARAIGAAESLSDIAKSIGLSYSCIDPGAMEATVAESVVPSDGASYYMLPRIGCDSSGVLIAWIANDAASPDSSQGENTVKKAARAYSAAGWERSSVVTLGTKVPTSLAAGLDGGVLSVAWTCDSDGDLSDPSDTTVESDLRPLLDAGNVANAQFVVAGDGGGSLTYYKDGGIENATDSRELLSAGTLESSEYQVIADGASLAVVQLFSDGERSGASIRRFDAGLGEWTDSFAPFETEDTMQYLSAAYGPNGVPVLVGIVEREGTLLAPGVCDLVYSTESENALSVVSLEYLDSELADGGEVTVVAGVRNDAFERKGDYVTITDSNGGYIASEYVEVDGGSSSEVLLTFRPYAASADDVASWSANTSWQDDGPTLDFHPANLTLECSDHELVVSDESAVLTVSNSGIVGTPNAKLEIYDWDSGKTLRSFDVAPLSVGEEESIIVGSGGFLRALGTEYLGARIAVDFEQASIEDDSVPIAAWSGEAIGQEIADDTVVNSALVDVGALARAIASAEDARENVVVSADGTDVYPYERWVSQSSWDALDAVLASAKRVYGDGASTQGDFDAQVSALNAQLEKFNPLNGTYVEPDYGQDEQQIGPGSGGSTGGSTGGSAGGSADGERYDESAHQSGGLSMHRLYNPYSGEHFYTADEYERDAVEEAGWTYEGIGWMAPEAGDPVYRVYNSYAGEHHYTLDADERDYLVEAGWTDEGVGWYSDSEQAVPLYREYNPYMFSCNHNYTSDKAEHDGLVELGWLDEGIAWYGV